MTSHTSHDVPGTAPADSTPRVQGGSLQKHRVYAGDELSGMQVLSDGSLLAAADAIAVRKGRAGARRHGEDGHDEQDDAACRQEERDERQRQRQQRQRWWRHGCGREQPGRLRGAAARDHPQEPARHRPGWPVAAQHRWFGAQAAEGRRRDFPCRLRPRVLGRRWQRRGRIPVRGQQRTG